MQGQELHGWIIISSPTARLILTCGVRMFSRKVSLVLRFTESGDQYEAIYFRPFNFTAGDSLRKIHSIQYIAPPTYGWEKIRTEHPGIYEQPLDPAPDPNGWFHVRVVVNGSKVSVFVNNSAKPSLDVARLSDVKDGKIGMWVGDDSGGRFRAFADHSGKINSGINSPLTVIIDEANVS